MAAEDENAKLLDQQGLHGHGYGLELAYGIDFGSTKVTLGKEIKKLQLHGEILEEAISAIDYQKFRRLTEKTIPNKLNLIKVLFSLEHKLNLTNHVTITARLRRMHFQRPGIFLRCNSSL